jgi:ribosome assembly protein YihI (activator of Der GTPase)
MFHDNVPDDNVMGLMADAVVRSKAGRDALEKTGYMKKHDKKMEQEAMDRIQEHMDEVGLSAKHCPMMS